MSVRRAFAAVFLLGVVCTSGSVVAGDVTGWELPKLPLFNFPNGEWYPDSAVREGLEGRVLVGFDIGSDGRPKNIAVIWGENGDGNVLAANAVRLVGMVRFKVPTDWAHSGAWRRWRLGVVYRLIPSGQSCEFAIPVETMGISRSRLRGSPVRTQPAPGGCPGGP